MQCTVYSIVQEKDGLTLYDIFMNENVADFREEVREINNRLKLIGTIQETSQSLKVIFTFLKMKNNKQNRQHHEGKRI